MTTPLEYKNSGYDIDCLIKRVEMLEKQVKSLRSKEFERSLSSSEKPIYSNT